MDEVLRFIGRAWPIALALGPGLWAVYRQWKSEQKETAAQRASLIQIAQEAAGEVIEELRKETDRLRGRVDELEVELRDLHRTHTNMIADKDAKIALLEGEKRQLEEQVAAYERLLERHGIPIPKRSQPYWEVPAGTGGDLIPAAPPVEPTTTS